ncbi:MAG: hypothetical protein J0G32_01165 [Alphaproteobacteria bacterium]|nr:hypothetical protein [Alphaproteobacteria bacterium]OJV11969.1 MAG: hypothetical protein BGO27_06345 [Alphaproteobacteria bacterium 33-17]
MDHLETKTSFWKDYKPLIIIVLYCLLLSFIPKETSAVSYLFMGYFFIFFSLFKFFDLDGFVEGFSKYDIIAKKSRVYGYVYPFLELFLGISYLESSNIVLTNILTFILMEISGVGVILSIKSGRKIKCACLGNILNVPLSVVSIVENFGMGAMALYHLVMTFAI